MADTKGKIVAIYGNLVTAEVTGSVRQNAVAYCCRSRDGVKLKAEIIRLRNQYIDMQVFEATRGLQVGDEVEITSGLLSVTLGPGLLGQTYDGLQNPLPQLAEECGFFLKSGVYKDPLNKEVKWKFTPSKKVGDTVSAGDYLGSVPEGIFTHQIIVPPSFFGELTIEKIAKEGEYTIEEKIVTLKDSSGASHELGMSYEWPVKLPMKGYKDRLLPTEPLTTKQRIIDSFFPICKGGTYCIPGPFGAGKTVMQQITSRHAEVDVVIVAACGERAGEVVETLREFPELTDPKTGRPLMERTIIICNTSSMPVAAREASVYTGITLAEYYRLMGLDVLLLADSTSRWAQALREMSGRLEEIPGEEAFPAYLESVIASFYERAGLVELRSGEKGSVTVGGTVSPAGGNFEEPVTQATLKVVGAFHGLSRARADARRFPSMDPIESWSKYQGSISEDDVAFAKNILRSGNEVGQMMTVVGEEGVSIDDFILFLKSELLDRVYLQQNAFDDIDAACSLDRQKHTFSVLLEVLNHQFSYESKDAARTGFFQLQEAFLNWNLTEWESQAFKDQESKVKGLL
ncbi:V-type ATP synthase subunit A [Candidatus Uabimicrobium amorphum]|uniref:V-type ATP synthase alpha chain n=1 Tax=Uabimicrobium amorphum TaxID=2596890 RepID=A0A5S9F4A8_UABAM|nr:V-type ATP synthase subunit A [Candidatus Uabimicrobium amorphum]BBM85352.1 V-type ATP synthase alpha chain [Candidatus Uabimicrobium amorphum]